jgi:hypothetical protein
MAKQNCREEINRINKKTNIKVACMKRELKFWQIVSVGTVVMGMLLEVVLVICDTKVTSADELIMKGVDLIWSNLANN